MSEPAPHNRPFPPGAFEPYVPAVVPPDPERDKRVAARRAADASRAAAALDRLLAAGKEMRGAAWDAGWAEGYRACELQHNCHYARSCATCGAETECGGVCPNCAAAHRERQP